MSDKAFAIAMAKSIPKGDTGATGAAGEVPAAALATKEASSTASKAYSVGDYLYYNSKLYKVTADIASGGTITPNTNCVEVKLADDVSDLKSQIGENGANILSAYPTDTAIGAIASFSDGAALPVKALTVDIEPVQSGSGDPSPDNVRPITGHTGVNVWRTGVNVWDGEYEVGGINDTTGEKVHVSSQLRSKNYIPVVPGQSYFMNAPNIGLAGAFGYAYDANKVFIDRIRIGSAVHIENLSFAVPANCSFILFKIGNASYDTSGASINYPSTDHDYHAYTGQTFPISWQSEAGTVYGGTLNVTTGVLTVTHKGVDMGSLTYGKNTTLSGVDRFIYAATDATSINQYAKTAAITSVFDAWAIATLNNNLATDKFGQLANQFYFYIAPNVYADGTAFAIAMTGQTLVYPLATPQTIQLTPAQLSTLAGENNVWADTGDVSAEYRADPTLYIEKLTGSTEDDMIADSAIANGKYFLVGNRLFKATAAIAAGAQLTVGTNCVETNLAAALNALNS